MWGDNKRVIDSNGVDVEKMKRVLNSRLYGGKENLQLEDFQCLSTPNNEARLNRHPMVERSNDGKIENANKHKDNKPFSCRICRLKYTYWKGLKRHIIIKHHGGENVKDYRCSECPYETNYKRCFKLHLDKHRGIVNEFQCNICERKFTKKYSYKIHMNNKHIKNENGKLYKCTECSFDTNYKQSLQIHLNSHTNVKRFQCAICCI